MKIKNDKTNFKKKKKPTHDIMSQGNSKNVLGSFSIGYLLMGMQPTLKSSLLPQETLLE